MCPSMKLLLTLFTMVVAQQCTPEEGSEGRCLLAKKKVMGKVSLIQEQSMEAQALEQLSLKHRDWRIRHQQKEFALNASKTLLDRFIEAQSTSSSHCSSRLMESKRILDGILADMKTLNGQISSREEVLEVETENLKITKMSIDATITEYTESITVCKTERKEAFEELAKYTKELEELNSIANPSMRMEISHSVTIKKKTVEEEEPEKPTGIDKEIALLDLDTKFSKEMCLAFLEFGKRHTHHKVFADPVKKGDRACDQQRKELQEAFEKAYKEIRELKEATRLRTIDETCFTTAETVKTATLVPLVSQRDIAVEKIEVASQAIAALEPVLKLVKMKAEKLRTHITETLTPECKEAGDASEVLVKVRELIISLEECPGRNDFKLKIPAEEEPTPPTKAPVAVTEAPVAATEAPEEEEPTKAPVAEEEPTEAPVAATEAPEKEVTPDMTDNDEGPPANDAVPSDDAVPTE